ncbi:ZFY16 protein, partial [Bucco capensis]|nr:ZFY16 protein [Bucco capensis]
MDSYFKAAVCDLDKLLDEFEQNTGDECDCYRTPQNPYDSKHHSLSSVLDCLQRVYQTPKQQEDANSFTSLEDISLPSHTGTSETHLSYLPQNEKSIAGPDLLSTVDSGSLNESQASNMGRCSIPVCDLVNDTGNLVHSVAAHEDAEKLQPNDFQYSEGLIGFDISCIPVPTCVSPAACSGVSSIDQSDGDSMLQDLGCLKTEEINHLSLKLHSYATARISDPCNDQHRTASVKCSEVFDQPEQTADLNTPNVPEASQNLNAYSPKDEKVYDKLPGELQDQSACSAVSKEMHERNVIEKLDSEDKTNVESTPSDMPERPPLHRSHATLPGNCVSPGSSRQTEAEVELEQSDTEKNLGSEELHSNEILNTVSTSCISVEDVQTTLSCLPLPESICGSLVVTEEKINALPQNEMAEVVSDTLTVHSGKSNTDFSSRESCENTDCHEQEGYIAEINESIAGESTDGEKYNTENVIDDSDSQEIKTFASTSLEYEAEPYSVGIDSYYNESMIPVVADFTVEKNVVKCETLISDAELDDFLYGQSLQSSVVKSLDSENNLVEADTEEENLTGMNNLDLTEVTEEYIQAKLEEIKSINSSCKIPLTNSESESATEEHTSHIQDTTESGSEALSSSLCSEGARPKQLLCLSQGAVGQRQLNRIDVLEKENEEASSVSPETLFSGTGINAGKNSDPVHSGESSSETGGNQTSENVESLQMPATLSWKQPLWVPDSEAPNCMNCQVKFTFTKRRHHCRACGKVFCGGCCKRKCKLQYMEKEARVCTGCYDHINKAQAFERTMSSTDPRPGSSISSEHSSADPPSKEAQASATCATSSSVSVLKSPGSKGPYLREQRRVCFADGILPSGEVAGTRELPSGTMRPSKDVSPINSDLPDMHIKEIQINPEGDKTLTKIYPVPEEESDPPSTMDESRPFSSGDVQQAVPGQGEVTQSYIFKTLETEVCSPTAEAGMTSSSSADQTAGGTRVSPSDYRALCGVENCFRNAISLVPDGDELPPLLLATGAKGKDPLVEEHPSRQQIIWLIMEGGPCPLTFILNANLLVNVKLVTYSSEKCWYFSTNGLHGLGQAEIVILLQCLPDESIFPGEIFKLFIMIYKDAMNGRPIRNMGNITFTENFFPEEYGGLLFVSPTFQKLDDQILPDNPFLYGILIHKVEVRWAKVLPLRLMLRLGAEFDAYPTPVVSFRQRKALFNEVERTILDTFADFRNDQYNLHTIEDLFVNVERGRSCIKIPLREYNEIMKVINSSGEPEISLGASFNSEADSHLVCALNEDGTQAISAAGHGGRVTCTSFVVFKPVLEIASGFAETSIVEDGLMIQITQETMKSLRQALREKKDFKILCGKRGAIEECVDVCWVNNEDRTNKGVLSPIDGKSMKGTQSEKLSLCRDIERSGNILKCTQIYYFLKDHEASSFVPHQFAKEFATACSAALGPHIRNLKNNGMNKIGIRITVDSDMVEYLAGSGGHLLPLNYLKDLDSALIPLIHGGMSDPTKLPLKIELVFFIIECLF